MKKEPMANRDNGRNGGAQITYGNDKSKVIQNLYKNKNTLMLLRNEVFKVFSNMAGKENSIP
jgi:hypothetical protein